MIKFNNFKDENYEKLKEMMIEFYTSDAVDTPLDEDVIVRLLDDILSGKYSVKGIEAYYKNELVGFGVITSYYTSEIAGETIQLEDLFIKEGYRSKGIAREYILKVREAYPHARRFRLEVCPNNERAIKLYDDIGFKKLSYNQMIIDVEKNL